MSQINRCFDIIELFFENPNGLSLSQISASTDIPMATAHRMLSVIRERGYIHQDSQEIYHLSLLLPSMGAHFIAGTGFIELMQPHLDRLAKETGEHVRLSAVVKGQLIWVLRAVQSSHGLQYRGSLDTRIIPHVTASGKMWLSSLSNEEAVRAIAQWDISKSRDYGGPNAVTSIKGLLRDLEAIRAAGYSVIMEEAEVGVCAVAVAVPDRTDARAFMGTLSIAGPTARLNRNKLKALVPKMKEVARRIGDTWNVYSSVSRDDNPRSGLGSDSSLSEGVGEKDTPALRTTRHRHADGPRSPSSMRLPV